MNMKSTADIVITAPSSEFKPPARIRHNPAKKTKEPANFLGLDGLLIKTEMLRDPDWMANRKLFARTDQQSPDEWIATVFRVLSSSHRADPWVLYINGSTWSERDRTARAMWFQSLPRRWSRMRL